MHTHIHGLGCHFHAAGWLSHGLLGLRMQSLTPRSWEPGGVGAWDEEPATGGSVLSASFLPEDCRIGVTARRGDHAPASPTGEGREPGRGPSIAGGQS